MIVHILHLGPRYYQPRHMLITGSDHEEMHYKYHLTVIHGKSEYSYKGPVISLMRSSNEVTIITLFISSNKVVNL